MGRTLARGSNTETTIEAPLVSLADVHSQTVELQSKLSQLVEAINTVHSRLTRQLQPGEDPSKATDASAIQPMRVLESSLMDMQASVDAALLRMQAIDAVTEF